MQYALPVLRILNMCLDFKIRSITISSIVRKAAIKRDQIYKVPRNAGSSVSNKL